MTYTATVTRDQGYYQATVRGLEGAHTFARTLPKLDTYVREVVVLAADLPDEAMGDLDIEYRFTTKALNEAARLARRRRRIHLADERLTQESARLARELVASGYSTRDVAAVLGISPGRVSQITQQQEA